MLRIDAVRGLGEVRVHVGSSCRVLSWAPAGKRILLRCGRYVEERTPRGSVAARVLSPGPTSWLPGSSTALLSFRRGDLWTWTPRAGARLLVRNAAPFPDPLSLSD
jgi:hypothetical protein